MFSKNEIMMKFEFGKLGKKITEAMFPYANEGMSLDPRDITVNLIAWLTWSLPGFFLGKLLFFSFLIIFFGSIRHNSAA